MGQLGRAKKADGTGGTAERDLQLFLGSLASNGETPSIAFGGDVRGQADLKYWHDVITGWVPTGRGQSVVVTWPANTVGPVTVPSSGSRLDVIYADETGVWVKPEGQQPSNAIILDKKRIKAGASSTSASVSEWDKRFLLPYGSTLGELAVFEESYAQGQAAIPQKIDWCSLDFWVPTDRRVEVRGIQCIFGQWEEAASDPVVRTGMGSMRYQVYLDGSPVAQFEMRYDRVWNPQPFTVPLSVTQGSHKLRVEREKMPWSPAQPKHFGGGVWQKASVRVVDVAIRE